jgi:DNA primase
MSGEKLTVGRVTVELSNTHKVLFPDGITKGDLVGLPAFVKTTGGNGLHVHVPLNARQDFGTVREFARQAAELLAARNPDLVTTEQRKDKRGPRIYADLMRNAYAELAVAPWAQESLRRLTA